jgi:hypothetical protein
MLAHWPANQSHARRNQRVSRGAAERVQGMADWHLVTNL